jgi:hypothetical protein
MEKEKRKWGTGHNPFYEKQLSQILPGNSEENHEKPQDS